MADTIPSAKLIFANNQTIKKTTIADKANTKLYVKLPPTIKLRKATFLQLGQRGAVSNFVTIPNLVIKENASSPQYGHLNIVTHQPLLK